jgi:hypothetical protein
MDRFLAQNSLAGEPESRQFEHFANYCVVAQYSSDNFDVLDVTAPEGTESIDGVAVLFDETLMLSKEDAAAYFSGLRPRQQVGVTYVFTQAKRSESFDSGEILKFGSGALRVFDGAYADTEGTLGELAGIHDVVVENMHRVTGSRPTCLLFYTCSGVWKEDSGLRKYLDQVVSTLESTSNFGSVKYEPVDRERLIKLWQQTHEPVRATFAIQHYVPIPQIPGVDEAYLALVPARDFIENALTEPDGRMRATVFEQNVRAFLGEDNPVNQRIQSSLRDATAQGRFALLNNGITIVAPDVRVQSSRISVTGYQIVNGCQTSHVLFRNRAHVTDRVLLPVKVIATSDPDILSQVVQATNSQTDVDETQFLSIIPFVQKLGAYFDAFAEAAEDQPRLYFERRVKQYAEEDVGRSRVFDITRVTRCFAAMFLDLPHLAARYPTQIFREERSKIFQPDHLEKAYYVAALAMYRLELALGNQYVPREHQTQKWHALMVMRYQVAGPEVPALNSKKLDAFCDKVLTALASGGKASAPPFIDAMRLLEKLGVSGRDRLKSQKSADDIKRHFAAVEKKSGK